MNEEPESILSLCRFIPQLGVLMRERWKDKVSEIFWIFMEISIFLCVHEKSRYDAEISFDTIHLKACNNNNDDNINNNM